MNSFRIGAIGVMVEYWGQSMAEGFLHDFEGWVIFMACTGLLIAELWVLSKIGKESLPLRGAFGLDFPEPTPRDARLQPRSVPKAFIGAAVIVVATMLMSTLLPEREEVEMARKDLELFPDQLYFNRTGSP